MGSAWEANCNGTWGTSSSSTIVFQVGNGSYNCSAFLQNSLAYLTYTPTIPVKVAGAPTTVNFSFEKSYPAWFAAVNLPNSPSYGLDIVITGGPIWVGTGFGGSSHNFSYPMLNGTYNFTASCGYSCTAYVASPPNGSYRISGGPAYNLIDFTPNTSAYPTFTESGLAAGSTWGVNLTNATGTTWVLGPNTTLPGEPTQSTSILVPYGNYTFTVRVPPGYSASPSLGYLPLDRGATPFVCIEFTTATDPVGSPCGGYGVTFNAYGLPRASPFCANVSTGNWGCVGGGGGDPKTVFLNPLFDGTYNFSIPAQGSYVAFPSAGPLVIRHDNLTVNVTFGIGPFYQATFQESGLPTGTTWAAEVRGLNTTSNTSRVVVGGLPNGTYSFVIPNADGYGSNPRYSTFWVFGANVTINLSFSFLPPQTYAVTFSESGLPAGSTWSISIGTVSKSGSTSSLQVDLVNGTYAYSARSNASHNCTCAGRVNVAGPTGVLIQFFPDSYELSFHETGLPGGTGWAVLIGTRSNSSLSSTIGFVVRDGTYGYVVLGASGYFAVPPSGAVLVNGTNVSVDIAMHPVLYPIVFVVLGLSNGTNWSVHVVNVSLGINETVNSSTNSLTVFLPNGTYLISFHFPSGYSSSPGSTTITVAGRPTSSVSVHATPPPPAKATLLSAMGWELLFVALGTAAGVLVIGLALRRRHKPG